MPEIAIQSQVFRKTTANGALKMSPFTPADISKTVNQVFEASDISRPINIKLQGEEYDGFYNMLGYPTNYRRNYFRVSCSISVSKGNSKQKVSDKLVLYHDGEFVQIKAFSGFMRSSDGNENLRQYTAKRDRGPVTGICLQYTTPAELVSSQCKLLYQRIQFKSSGKGGNANHKFALSRSSLVFELYAQLANDREVLINTYESQQFIIRGRSEKYFRSLEECPDLCMQLEIATRSVMLGEFKSMDMPASKARSDAISFQSRKELSCFTPSLPLKGMSYEYAYLPSPVGSLGIPTEMSFGMHGKSPLPRETNPSNFGNFLDEFPKKSPEELLDSFFDSENLLRAQHEENSRNTSAKPLFINTSSIFAPHLSQHRSETVTSPIFLYSPPLSVNGSFESLQSPIYASQPDSALYQQQLPWDTEKTLASLMSNSSCMP